MAQLAENSPFPILQVSKDGVLLYANPASESLLRMWNNRLGEPVADFLSALVDEAIKGERSRSAEIAHGSRTFVFRAVLEKTNECVGIYGYDITEQKRWEEAYLKSEQEYRLIFDAAGVGRAQADPSSGRLMRANRRFCEFTGYSTSELLGGMTLSDITHPEDRERDEELFRKMVVGEIPEYTIEKRYLRKDGATVWVEVHASLVRDAVGRPAELTKAVVDITSQKRVIEAQRASLEQLRLATDAARLGFWHLNLKSNELTWSEMCRELIGVPRETQPSISYFESLVHPDDRESVRAALMRSIEERADHEKEYRVVWPGDGSIHWLHDLGRVLCNSEGEPTDMMGVSMDITRRRAQEELLHRTVADLSRSNKDLEHFAYVASHDLMEPLRTIRSYLQLIEKRYGERLDVEGGEFLRFATEGAARLQTLTTDLLTYARVGTRARPLEPAEAQEALDHALDALRRAIVEKKAVVTYDPLPRVVADGGQLTQVFQNLVGNAIKFHREGESPQIKIGVHDNAHEWLFSVSDNGIGIDPEFHSKVFMIFQKLHTTEHYQGSGVGLAICKRIVERHGGQICFDSKPGAGTTFYFTLPKQASVISLASGVPT